VKCCNVLKNLNLNGKVNNTMGFHRLYFVILNVYWRPGYGIIS
jgi:hypothetical protein